MPVALHDYQNDAVTYWLDQMARPQQGGLTIIPMGGGKTFSVKCAIKLALDREMLDGFIYLVPQVGIEAQFMGKDEEYIYAPPTGSPVLVSFPKAIISTPRRPKGRAPKKHSDRVFREFCANPKGKVLCTTHAQFLKWTRLLPEIMNRIGVVVDEVHHSGEDETKLFRLLDSCHARGAFLGGVTATNWRTDGAGLFPLTLHAEEIYAVPYSHLITNYQFPVPEFIPLSFRHGQTHPIITLSDAVDVADLIKSQEMPPTLIHIQAGSVAGEAAQWAATIIDGLVAAGFSRDRVVNATGDGKEISPKLAETLEVERDILQKKGYLHRKIDVIVSCGRCLEGTDWPSCALVISVGQSQALIREIQKFRATRRKTDIPDFPAAWKDRCVYTVFTPRFDPSNPDEQRNQSAIMLENAAMLECSEVSLDFARYFDRLTEGKRYPPAVRTWVVSSPLDPVVAKAKQDYLSLLAAFQAAYGRPPSMKEAVEALQASNLSPTDSLFALREMLNAEGSRSEDIRASMKTMLGSFVEKLTTTLAPNASSQTVRDLYWEALLDLAQQHVATLVDVYQHPIFRGLRSRLDAPTLVAVTQTLIQRRDSIATFSDPEIASLCQQFEKVVRYYPDTKRGEKNLHAVIPNLGYEVTVFDLDRALQRRGFDLARLVAAIPWIELPPVVVPQYKAKHGARRVPVITSAAWATPQAILQARSNTQHKSAAKVFGVPGENYVGLALAAARGWRGLPFGTDLTSLLR